jgi:hypothetical protein
MGSESNEAGSALERVVLDFSKVVPRAKPITCTRVYTFPPDFDPQPDMVRKYCSGPAGEPPAASYFKANSHPVDVYQKDDGTYLVLPRTKQNERFFRNM